MRDTRGETNTLKGLAILVVMLNHFVLVNVTDSVGGIAYTFLAVFFWVSGWGVQISLERRSLTPLAAAPLVRFWTDRLLRLLPLYYVALLVRDAVSGTHGSLVFYINIYSEGHFWFVPAIVNCYLAAPLLHYCLRRNRGATLIAALVIVAAGTAAMLGGLVPAGTLELLGDLQLTYKRAFLLHVFVFLLGMLAATERERLVKTDAESLPGGVRTAYLALFAAFPLGYWLAKNLLHGALGNGAQLCMLGLALILCLVGVRYRVSFRLLAWLGSISYGLYLFHMTYRNLLVQAGVPQGFQGLAAAVALLPLLALAVMWLEKGAASLARVLSPARR